MFSKIIQKKKSVILDKWIQIIFDSYSSNSSNFLNLEKNQFSNPIGYTIRTNAELIFNQILGECNLLNIKLCLIDIIKIRAVQEFSPSQAIAFIFQLKKILFDELQDEMKDPEALQEFLTLESTIDRIALIAFDLYAKSREKVYQIRINQIRSNSSSVINKIEKN